MFGLAAVKRYFFVSALAAIAFLTGSAAFAADIAVSVDPSAGTVDDTFLYQVLVRGTDISGYSRPVLNGTADFDIAFASTKISHILVNGSLVNSLVFMYRVEPKEDLKPGKYHLPGGYFERGAKRDRFEGTTVDISGGGGNRKRADLGIDFVQVVDQTEPYVGQQVSYRAEIATRSNIVQATLSEIEFDGFYRESYGKKREEMRRVGADTRVYSVREALFPTSPGPVAIPKRSMTAMINLLNRRGRSGGGWDPFFGALPDLLDFAGDYEQVEKKFSASGITINVKPLPPPPQGAQSYIPVGTITVASSTDKKLIKQGEGCSYQVELYGDANLRPLELSATDSKALRIFPDKPEVQTFIEDGRIKFRKRFSFAVIPLVSGKVELPSFSFVVFDPDKKEYKTVQTPLRVVSVIPGESSQTPGKAPTSLAPNGNINQEPGVVTDLRAQIARIPSANQTLSVISTSFVIFFIPALCILVMTYGARLQRLLSDPVLLSRRNALPRATTRLDALSKANESDRIEGLLSIMKNFIGDKTGRKGESLTAAEAKQLLSQLAISESLQDEAHTIMLQLEGLVYSGLPEHSRNDELMRLEQAVRQTIKQIDEGTET